MKHPKNQSSFQKARVNIVVNSMQVVGTNRYSYKGSSDKYLRKYILLKKKKNTITKPIRKIVEWYGADESYQLLGTNQYDASGANCNYPYLKQYLTQKK